MGGEECSRACVPGCNHGEEGFRARHGRQRFQAPPGRVYAWGVASQNPPIAAFSSQGSPLALAGLPPVYLELEAVHAELRRAALLLEHDVEPLIDLAPLARGLERAFAALYDAFDGRADGLAAARATGAEIDRAVAAMAFAPPRAGLAPVRERLGRARTLIGLAEGSLARVPPALRPAAPPLLASIDAPRLHVLDRPSMRPALRVPKAPPGGVRAPAPPPLPDPQTFAELRQAIAELKRQAGEPSPAASAAPAALPEASPAPRVVPEGFAADLPDAIDDGAFLRARTRECFEEVAMVSMQRAPLIGEPWRASLLLERRMLAAIDVIAAIGATAVEHVPRLLADAPVKDATRAFAVAMVLGCIAGRDALAAAEHVLLGSDRDAEFVEAFGAALEIVPHDLAPLALRSLLGEADPAVRAMAVDVLGHRGLASHAELAAAAGDAAPVAARALVHLALLPSPELPALLDAASGAEDRALREAAWTAMALSGHPRGSQVLAAGLDGEGEGTAALLLAIAGDEQDARELCRRTIARPSPGLVRAAGWAGDVGVVGSLIDLLEGDAGEEVALAAAEALERITGAGLRERAPADDEEILVPDPPEPDVGEPRAPKLSRVVGDPRDPPPEPTPEMIERPSTDPARWRAFWMERGAADTLGVRYRRGHPYTPLVSLRELDAGRCTPAERRLLQRELCVRTGAFVRFDPHDLVVVQEEAIRAWHPLASGASSAPGRWLRPARRST